MKIDFRNTKINLSNHTEEQRAKFQRFAFENGCRWRGSGCEVSELGSPFYFIDSELKMTQAQKIDKDYFYPHPNRQIFYSDLFPDETDPKDLRIKELESQNASLIKEVQELKEALDKCRMSAVNRYMQDEF